MKKLLLFGLLVLPGFFANAGTLSLGGEPVSLHQNDLTSEIILTCTLDENESIYIWDSTKDTLPPVTTFETCADLQNELATEGLTVADVFPPHETNPETYFYAHGCDNNLGAHTCADGSVQDAINSGYHIEDFGLILEMLQPQEQEINENAEITNTSFTGMGTTISSVITSKTPTLLIILGALIGLGMLVRFTKKQIGNQ